MLTKEENDLLTQTGPGTRMGDLMRRFWQPVAVSEELPPDGEPLAVRIMSEDLVLFRDDRGRPGLIGIRCPHRGADLSYGRAEDGGLRCIYHGWLFGIDGRCLEQPGEPPGSDFYTKVRHLAYPCQEVGGVIFTYMGPGQAPVFPVFEALTAPEENRYMRKMYQDSNYLNALEGNQDPSHVSFLHKQLGEDEASQHARGFAMRNAGLSGALAVNEAWGKVSAPTIEVERADFGIRQVSLRQMGSDRVYLRMSTWILPNVVAAPGPTAGDGHTLVWHVPINDTCSWRYSIDFRRSGALVNRASFEAVYRSEIGPNYQPVRNRENRFLQDRHQMKTRWYSGFGSHITVQDVAITDLQGRICDRTEEHLGYADKIITAARRMVFAALHELKEGHEPGHIVRNGETSRLPLPAVTSETFSGWEDRESYYKKRIREEESAAAKAMGI